MRWIFVMSGLWTGLATAVDYKSAACTDSDFLKGGWQDLCSQEPRICEELKSIAQASGEPGPVVPMTNCQVRWPIDETGKSMDGIRSVVMDKVWYKDGSSTPSQGGMRIYYHHKLTESVSIDGAVFFGASRSIRGFSFCRTPKICDMMGIPVAKTSVPSVTKVPLKTETKQVSTGISPSRF